ncbi:MAG: hypothetical protein HY556_07055 [Euryarchaeota archaeon]|nr:hypothetical protein [Euryarchaeota archaeon]
MIAPRSLSVSPALLRSASQGTITSLSVIERQGGRSRNWTRVLADQLAQRGFLQRVTLRRVGRGRPTIGYKLTKPGIKLLDALVDAEVADFAPGKAVAGPIWSLATYGFPFVGSKDAFVLTPGRFQALVETVAPLYLMREPARDADILFPRPEALVIWLLESGEERFVLMAPLLARKQIRAWEDLWSLAEERGVTGRLAYVLTVTGQASKIPKGFVPTVARETLLQFGGNTEDDVATTLNVAQPPQRKRFDEMIALYGDS